MFLKKLNIFFFKNIRTFYIKIHVLFLKLKQSYQHYTMIEYRMRVYCFCFRIKFIAIPGITE